MSYRLLKLVSDYVSGGVYTNRLELGDSGLGGPVDIRFIGEAGWIENVHSVFFSVNGTDTYPSSGGKGKITTAKYTNELVFFDELNTSGRTLSQLYGGLWIDNGVHTRLLTVRPIDMQYESIIHVDEIIGGITAGGFNISAISGEVLSFYDDATGAKTLTQLAAGGGVTAHSALTQLDYASAGHTGDLPMGGNDIRDVFDIYMHEAGTWDYLHVYNPAGDKCLIQLMSFSNVAASLNLVGADLSLAGNDIKDMGARYGKLNTLQEWYYNSSGGGIVKKMELSALAFNLFCKLDMGNHNIEDVNIIKGHPETDLEFYDDVLNETKTLSQLATAGLWEVSGTAIRPKDYDIIEGRAAHDLTIKPASGGILYLG